MYVEVKKDHQIKIKKKASNPKITKQIIKNGQNRGPGMIFSTSKYMTVGAVFS
jgi:hypothetical protein